MAGVGRVFHLAALADIVPSIQRPDEYFTTNVDGTFTVDVLPNMILLGLGAGMALNPLLLAAMSDVEASEAGL